MSFLVFISLLVIKLMKYKLEHKYRYTKDNNKIMLYSNTVVTTVNGISKYSASYADAIERISK